MRREGTEQQNNVCTSGVRDRGNCYLPNSSESSYCVILFRYLDRNVNQNYGMRKSKESGKTPIQAITILQVILVNYFLDIAVQ